MSVSAVCVDPLRIDEIWPTVAPMVRRALDKTGFSEFEDIERDILIGNSLLWLAWDGAEILAAAVTQITNDVMTIVACAGTGLMLWRDLIGKLEAYAMDEGCTRSRIIGREGWARVLKERGYWQTCVILERQL